MCFVLYSKRLYLVFLLLICSKTTFSTKDDLLIISTIDGSIQAIQVKDGRILWTIQNRPILEQAFNRKEQVFRIVPSLNGMLYLLEGRRDLESDDLKYINYFDTLISLPINTNLVIHSNYQLTENSILTGSKEIGVYAIRLRDGQVLYNCSKLGCTQNDIKPHYKTDAVLLIRESSNTLREVGLIDGSEIWNYTVRIEHLTMLNTDTKSTYFSLAEETTFLFKNQLNFDASSETDNIFDQVKFAINLKLSTVLAYSNENGSLLWSKKMHNPIVKVWGVVYSQSNLQPSVKKLSFQSGENSYSHEDELENLDSNPTGVFLGQYKSQYFVQLLDSNETMKPLHFRLRKKSSNIINDLNPSMVGFYHAFPNSPEPSSTRSDIIPYRHYGRRLWPYFHPDVEEIMSEKNQCSAIDPTTCIGPPNFRQISFHSSYADDEGQDSFTSWIFDSASDFVSSMTGDGYTWGSTAGYRVPNDRITVYMAIYIWAPQLIAFIVLIWVIFKCAQPSEPLISIHSVTSLTEDSYPSSTMLVTNDQNNNSIEMPVPQTLSSFQKFPDAFINEISQCVEENKPSKQPVVSSFQSTYDTEFQHVRHLGRGGFGQVFEVVNRIDGCHYAIKRIRLENKTSEKDKFMREVKDHPGIVRYHRAWVETPPNHWQEERDKTLLLLEEEFEDDDSYADNKTTNTTSQVDLIVRSRIRRKSSTASFLYGLGDPATGFVCLNSLDYEQELLLTSKTCNSSDSSGSSNSTFSDDGLKAKKFYIDSDDNPNNSDGKESQNQKIKKLPESNNDIIFLPHSSDKGNKRSSYNRLRVLSSIGEDIVTNNSIIDSDTKYCYLYIQMQLCLPTSLRDWLEEKHNDNLRPLRIELYEMFLQIVEAVHYLHSKSLMHRDLKPSNILFDANGRIKLADFGLVTRLFQDEQSANSNALSESPATTSSLADQPLMRKTRIRNSNSECQAYNDTSWMSNTKQSVAIDRRHTDNVGTILYMSPEQERGEAYDHRVDIFSLGLIFVELMLPFKTTMERIVCLTRAKKQELPQQLVKYHGREGQLALEMLHHDPQLRPETHEILAHDLFRVGAVFSNNHSPVNISPTMTQKRSLNTDAPNNDLSQGLTRRRVRTLSRVNSMEL